LSVAKVSVSETFGSPGLTWRIFQKCGWVKEKPKLAGWIIQK